MPEEHLDVVIAGGGVAALEAALALHAHAHERASITLVSPQSDFAYRPLSVREPFALGSARSVALENVARDVEGRYVPDAVACVAPRSHNVVLKSGDELPYEALVVATGARRVRALRHAVTFRGQEDADALHGLIQDLEGGYARRIAFVVPGGVTWSLPLYELALLTARRMYEMSRRDVELTLVTPEEEPLAIFRTRASREVAGLLEEAGIKVELATHAEVEGKGHLVLHPGERPLECDRIVALAHVVGMNTGGLPSDPDGFIPVDQHGRVQDTDDVYAAGDGTTFPVKQGGLACQQADAVAESIAARLGAVAEPRPFKPVLRGQLLTGSEPRYMRADLSGRSGDETAVSREILWWPPAKVAGMYLAPYLAADEGGRPASAESGVMREELAVLPADEGPEFELLGFERYTR